MEYELSFRMSPAARAETYHARLFISAHQENRLIGTEQIWETTFYMIDPKAESSVHVWAHHAIAELRRRMDEYLYGREEGATVKLMVDLFKQQEDLCVAYRPTLLGRRG